MILTTTITKLKKMVTKASLFKKEINSPRCLGHAVRELQAIVNTQNRR